MPSYTARDHRRFRRYCTTYQRWSSYLFTLLCVWAFTDVNVWARDSVQQTCADIQRERAAHEQLVEVAPRHLNAEVLPAIRAFAQTVAHTQTRHQQRKATVHHLTDCLAKAKAALQDHFAARGTQPHFASQVLSKLAQTSQTLQQLDARWPKTRDKAARHLLATIPPAQDAASHIAATGPRPTATKVGLVTQAPETKPQIQLAAAGQLSDLLGQLNLTANTSTPVAADTADGRFTAPASSQAVAALSSLETPVAIFEHLRNTFRYEPYFGLVKGATRTLEEQAGNDADLAAAFISLLRAKGIPARYVFGTIDLTLPQAASWLAVPQAQVTELLAATGIPHQLVGDGHTQRLQVDHVWVAAHIAYDPHRGADAPGTALKTWIELDVSFKQHTLSVRRDLESILDLPSDTLISNALVPATTTALPAALQVAKHANQLHHVQDLANQSLIDEVVLSAARLRNYLLDNNLTTETVFRTRTVSEERFGLLPVTDQYRVISTATPRSQAIFPEALAATVALTIAYQDQTIQHSAPIADLLNGPFHLSWSTTADGAELVGESEAAGTPIPAHLIPVTPTLTVHQHPTGPITKTAAAVPLGSEIALSWTFTDAGGSHTFTTPDATRITQATDTIVAGSVASFVVHAGTLPQATLQAQRDALAADASLSNYLRAVGLGYFYQSDRFAQINANVFAAQAIRAPSLLRVSYSFDVQAFAHSELADRPYTISGGHLQTAAVRDAIHVAAPTAGAAVSPAVSFNHALTASVIGANNLAQFSGDPTAVSTASLLQTANASGATVTLIPEDGASFTTTDLDPLSLANTAATKQMIVDALNAGNAVTFADHAVSLGAGTQEPVITFNPQTGHASHAIYAAGLAANLNAGARAQVSSPPLLSQILNHGANFATTAWLDTATPWLTVLPDANTVMGYSYLPAIAHTKNFLTTDQGALAVTAAGTTAAAIMLIRRIATVSKTPGIVNLTTAPTIVSPNADGNQDTFLVTADTPQADAWTFTISALDITDIILTQAHNQAPYTNNPSRVSLAWDPTGIPDGPYTWTLKATAGPNYVQTSGTLTLDATAPTASLSITQLGTGANTGYNFSGTAYDTWLKNWTIDIIAPDQTLQQLATSNLLVQDATFAAVPATEIGNGTYTARLTVTDHGGTSVTITDTLTVAADLTPPTLTITSPLTNPDTLHKGSQTLTIDLEDTGAAVSGIPTQTTAGITLAALTVTLDDTPIATSTSDTEITAGSHYQRTHTIDTATLRDGQHTLLIQGTDTAGNAVSASHTFLTSNPISQFAISPPVLTADTPAITISATLQPTAGTWTLDILNHQNQVIHTTSDTTATISQSIDLSAQPDGLYSLRLTAAGETPSLPFRIALNSEPPVAALTGNPDTPFTPDDGTLTTPTFRIREGLFHLQGSAYDPDDTNNVTYTAYLVDPHGNTLNSNLFLDTTAPLSARVQNATLGTLDFTMTANGVYDLYLDVTDDEQQTTTAGPIRILLDSQLKVGHFGFSQQDLVIPVSGFPLSVIRTYNSLHPQAGDFGPGWTWALKDLDIQHDEQRTTVDSNDGLINQRIGGGRNVTLTLPSGRRATYQLAFESQGKSSFGEYKAHFIAPPGVTTELQITGRNAGIYRSFLTSTGYPEWSASPGTPDAYYDFPAYTLTEPDGTTYQIARQSGSLLAGEHVSVLDDWGDHYFVQPWTDAYLQSITDPSGHRTIISDRSVDHFAADNTTDTPDKQILFERNADGRISAIRDPKQANGLASYKYRYDSQNRLTHVDKLLDAATATYETIEYLYANTTFPHYITSIKDPRGLTPMQTQYDDNGRMIGTIDAHGNQITLDHDLANRTETIFDRQGTPTYHTYDNRGNVLQTTNALGHTTTYTYDAADNETTITNGEGETTTYTYDTNRNRTSVTNNAGQTTHFGYDATGNQLWTRDPVTPQNQYTSQNTYDTSGNLLTTTNAAGQTTTNTYDPSGNLSATYNSRGLKTSEFLYNGANLSQSISYTHKADGSTTSQTRTFTYDTNGNQTSSSHTRDGKRYTSTTTYNAAGQVTQTASITETLDGQGNVTDTEQGPVSKTYYNPIGKPWKTQQYTSPTDSEPKTTFTFYDARGNVTRTLYDDNSESRTLYDPNGRAVASVRFNPDLIKPDTDPDHIPGYPVGSLTHYNLIGQVIRSERYQNLTITLSSAPDAQSATATDTIEALAYGPIDPANPDPNTITGALAAPFPGSTTTYDKAGRTLQSKTAAGAQTTYTYDPAGRQQSVTDTFGNTTTYAYDPAGRQQAVTDPRQATTSFTYDLLGRRTHTTFDDGTSTQTVYNDLGQRIAEIDQTGKRRDFDYDIQGRLLGVRLPETLDPETNTRTRPHYQYGYDDQGNLLTITDPKGRTTTFTYDHKGRQTARTLPNTGGDDPTEHTIYIDAPDCDCNGQVGYKIDFNGQLTQFLYDTDGRLTNKNYYPTDHAHISSLFNAGQPTNGLKSDLTGALVDDLSAAQYTALSATNHSQTFAYDPSGRQKSITTPATGTTEFSYDQQGRLVQETRPSGTITYTYNTLGQKIATTSSNTHTDFTYDTLGRLQTVTKDGTTHTYTYNTIGARETLTTSPDGGTTGTVTTYTYDKLNRLDTLINTKISDNSLLSFYDYTLAPDGRRTAALEIHRTPTDTLTRTDLTYTYDELNRLTQESSSAYQVDSSGGGLPPTYLPIPNTTDPNRTHTTTYTYDLVGNRLAKSTNLDQDPTVEHAWTYTYDDRDRLLTEQFIDDAAGTDNSTYTYDLNGSRIGETKLTDGTPSENATYTYSVQQRMVSASIERTDTIDAVTKVLDIDLSYTYDHRGVRTAQTQQIRDDATQQILQDKSVHYLVDHRNHTGYAQVLEEWHAPTNPTATDVKKTYTLGDDVLAHADSLDNVSTLLYDGHGTTRLLANSAGTIIQNLDYDAYGVNQGQTEIPNPQTDAEHGQYSSLGYSGEWEDNALGRQYLRARWYDQQVGGFTRVDPWSGRMTFPGTQHKYSYCLGSPIDRIDPSGLFSLVKVLAAVGVILILVGLLADARGGGREPEFGTLGGLHFEFAKLAQNVYNYTGAPPGWVRVPALLPTVTIADFGHPTGYTHSGFQAALYRKLGTSPIPLHVLAFRGTHSLKDWVQNYKQSSHIFTSVQYKHAMALADRVETALALSTPSSLLVLTGHSLGGGLASAAAMANGLNAVTFNPSGVKRSTVEAADPSVDWSMADSLITKYVVYGEILDWVQSTNQSDLIAETLTDYLPLGRGATAALGAAMPDSLGSQITLDPGPDYRAQSNLDRIELHSMGSVFLSSP